VRLPLILIVAGLAAAVCSQLGGVEGIAFGGGGGGDDGGPLGPEWAGRVPDVAGGLGLSAALCGALSWRWPDRVVAAVVAVLLALGTAFVLWWLLAPPHELLDLDGEPVGYAWWLWVAAAELAVATGAAAALARSA
jgi:hypothetical protein